ncbi:tetratricopeptide repeat protein [Simplicispira psychrophila]|uniref:tetratricopeptide repeat protein n=1 Tax=Simplicispira psychrophila TaxID=80882 RepID=UPI00068FA00B|nr:tetratricopeptide repeat protein [Simplicispira psychrophila]
MTETAAAPLADADTNAGAGIESPPVSAAIAQLLQQTMELALQCHRDKQWAEAAELYYAVLRQQPEHPDANHNLGAIAVEQGDPLAAIPLFQIALQADPKSSPYWVSLIDALMQAKEYTLATDILEDARRAGLNLGNVGELVERLVEVAMRRARNTPVIRGIQPPQAQSSKLARLYEANDFDAVIKLSKKIAHQYPQSLVGWKGLGAGYMRQGLREKAIDALQHALALDSTDFDALSNYGLALSARGELVQAEILLRQATRYRPRVNIGWFNLGLVLRSQGRFNDIERVYRSALDAVGDRIGVLINLSIWLTDLNRLTEAEETARQAIAEKANSAVAHVQLAMVLKDQGRLVESVEALRHAIVLDPNEFVSLSNLLFVANCIPDMDPYERFALYQEFDERFGKAFRPYWRPHTNLRSTARRLRVGYVAPVFRYHSSQKFLEPLFAHHNHERVELFAYANNYELDDEVTDRYRTYFDHWCETGDLHDQQLVDRIRADGIDVLVDIAGQTKGARLAVFASKPAPVSLHWLDSGYTTGLSAIDYYLTDAATVPPGSEDLFTEIPWRLPHTQLSYRPDAASMGAVGPLPALERGYITFGSLTRAVRLNAGLIATWAQLLQRVPHSKLVLNSMNFHTADICDVWIQRFADLGIPADRLQMGYQTPPWDVLRGIDIMLDCFPQNSGATLFESLYMGLPFVSLAGAPSMGTLGASVLTALGRPEWVAHSKEEYLDKLVALASDVPALAALRSGLRAEMQASALMDEPGFARDVEDAYFAMFQRWIDTTPEEV